MEEWGFFQECLLHDVRPVSFGYGLDLVINYVWSDGKLRDDALEAPHLVTLRMLGLDSLCFVGGLTGAMKDQSEVIDWGLSEIARIVPVAALSGLALAVEWEGTRRLEAKFDVFEILVADEVTRRQ